MGNYLNLEIHRSLRLSMATLEGPEVCHILTSCGYLPFSEKYISQFFSLMALRVRVRGVGGASKDRRVLSVFSVDSDLLDLV